MLKRLLTRMPKMGWGTAICSLFGILMIQSVYAFDIDEEIIKKQNETNARDEAIAEKQRADDYAKSLEGAIDKYMQSHTYKTIDDFLIATKKGAEYDQSKWRGLQRWEDNYQPPVRPWYEMQRNGEKLPQIEYSESVYPAIEGSYLIKSLLEKDYGLSIPFETNTIKDAFIKPKHRKIDRQSGGNEIGGDLFSWGSCASNTPLMLSSGIEAIGNYTLLSKGIQLDKYSRENAKDKAKEELAFINSLLVTMNERCAKEDRDLNGDKSFIVSYKKLLNDYASALEAGVQEEKANLAKIESDKRLVSEESTKAKQIAQNEHLSAVRSGKTKPETIEDAKALWQPSNGNQVVLSPPVKADSKTYMVSGKLVRMDGSNYIFEVYTGNDIKYFSCAIKNDSVQGKGTSLRFESEATMVGRFVNVTSYTTVAGVTRMAPVFDVLFIQN